MEKIATQLPRRGVTDAAPFSAQEPDVCPATAMRNAWPREVGRKRFNLSTRDPLTTLFSVGGSRVQAMGVVGAASGVTGYDNTDQTDIVSGTSRVSGAWIGQAVVLDPGEIWTVNRVLRDTRGTGGAMSVPPASVGGYGAFACCWHSTDDDVGYIATIGLDTGQTTDDNLISMVARFDLETPDSFTHTAYVVDHDAPYSAPLAGAQIPLAVSKIVQYGAYLFVAANHYIYVFRADNLTYIKRVSAAFAIEVQDIGCFTYAGQDYLWAAITGSAAISGPVVADTSSPAEAFGEFYRSGLSLYQIQYADDTLKTPTAVGGNCLRRWAIPQGTEDGDDGYEDHRTFRPSEYGVQRPRGGLVYALAIDTGGDVFFTRTNQGWGYDGSQSDQKPDGSVRDVTLCRARLDAAYDDAPDAFLDPTTSARYGLLTATTVRGWEVDIESYKRAYVGGSATYQTDIPQIVAGSRNPGPGTSAEGYSDAPSAFALAYLQSLGTLCVGGRRPNTATANVHGVRAVDGAIRWRTALGGMVLQNAIAANASAGTFIVGTVRNADWYGSSGAWCELFELDALSGAIVRTFDLGNAVMNNGVFDFSSNPAPVSLYAGAYAVAVNGRGQVLAALAPFRYSA